MWFIAICNATKCDTIMAHLKANINFVKPFESTITNRQSYTNPKSFHHTAATTIKMANRMGVATRPTLVRSEALKYR